MERFGRSRPGQFLAHHVTPRIDPWLYRATGGRVTSGVLIATAPLTTTGAKSGQPREVPANLLPRWERSDPDRLELRGGPKHPQWYYNLTAHPECRLGGSRIVATEVTDSDEYARLYRLAEQVYGGYRDYRAKTSTNRASDPHLPAQAALGVPDRTVEAVQWLLAPGGLPA